MFKHPVLFSTILFTCLLSLFLQISSAIGSDESSLKRIPSPSHQTMPDKAVEAHLEGSSKTHTEGGKPFTLTTGIHSSKVKDHIHASTPKTAEQHEQFMKKIKVGATKQKKSLKGESSSVSKRKPGRSERDLKI